MRPGIEPRNVCVVLNDVPRENWGFDGVGADQLELRYKVEV